MVSPICGRAVIDINATVVLHRDIIPYLLAAHGLTGCDTVATYFGIGKAAALRVLTSGVHALTYVSDTSRILSEITAQATPFMLACYGQTKCTSLTGHARKCGQTKWARMWLVPFLVLRSLDQPIGCDVTMLNYISSLIAATGR